MPRYYPIFLDVGGKSCAVVGGGMVALRKVESLREYGARVKVISPTLCPELSHLAEEGAIETILRDYESGDLKGAFVVVAATSDEETNKAVAREAREQGILVNVVDDPGHSDFIVPACFYRGEVAIAISTGGRSPALARQIRMKLEKSLGTEYAILAQLLAEVRSELKQKGIRVEGDAWQQALKLDLLLEMVRSGQEEEAKNKVIQSLKETG